MQRVKLDRCLPSTKRPKGPKKAPEKLSTNQVKEKLDHKDMQLGDVFHMILEKGIELKSHAADKVKNVRLWMEHREHVLKWQTLPKPDAKVKLPHFVHSLNVNRLVLCEPGRKTKEHLSGKNPVDDKLCFSLLWKGGGLHLEAKTEDQCIGIVHGFKSLIALAVKDKKKQLLEKFHLDETQEDEKQQDGEFVEEKEPENARLPEEELESTLRYFLQTLKQKVDVITHKKEYSREASLWLAENNEFLMWKSKRKTAFSHSCRLEDILLVQTGKRTLGFSNKHGLKAQEDLCFTLLRKNREMLNIQVDNKEKYDGLVTGFTLVAQHVTDGTIQKIKPKKKGGDYIVDGKAHGSSDNKAP